MQSLLIKDTTRAQREEIVRRALAACGGSCEGCNGCGNSGGGRVDAIYQPYIDGEVELAAPERGLFGEPQAGAVKKGSGGPARRFLFCVVTYGTARYDTGLPSSNVT